MIIFDGVTHYEKLGRAPILDDATVVIPTDRRIAVFGVNGAELSAVIQIVRGMITPRHGSVITPSNLSMIIGGPPPAMSSKLTVNQYLQDMARLHGVSHRDLVAFIVEWGEAEMFLRRPFAKLAPPERSRIIIPMMLGIPFSFYLVDGDPAGAAPKFKARFEDLFRSRIEETGALFAAKRQDRRARSFCDAGLVLIDGQLLFYENILDAIAVYDEHLQPLETPIDPDDEERKAQRLRQDEIEDVPQSGFFF